ncbi:MAG TPA: hypothetical protein PKO38_03135 [Bacillota bacterium]|jgi:galactose-1-phosphate uridylyltransferase|nr:hypothetical protein [Bacillota bacterium]HOB86668.1 hypothetical protein [Bacillota bacterium]HPT33186.1 hypothetical protein [Bacillota bacterium]HPZ65431.1 hypothetical protein [Bacillota bacterium]HQD05932.1 hypothetical protein [Bacillota bacterium]
MLEFAKRKGYAKILDPRIDFALNSIEVEYRRDPLTGESGRIAHMGIVAAQKIDYSVWDKPEHHEMCPFCPGNIERSTPRFPAELIPEGHIKKGGARVIANIAPYDRYSALTVMGPEHVMPLEKMSAAYLKDAFEAGLEFCRTVLEKERELPYSIIAWNYMPPSGGGLLHPHQQLIITDEPGNLYRKVMRESKNYRQKWGENFWEELCRREEEAGERFIGRIEEGYWLTAFCPQGVLGEIMAVFPGRSTIYDLDEKIIDGLVKGLLCLFKYFDSKNICSFNLALFAAPAGEGEKDFSLHIRVIPRFYMNLLLYTPDMSSMQVALQEPFSVVNPEEQCREIAPFFKS